MVSPLMTGTMLYSARVARLGGAKEVTLAGDEGTQVTFKRGHKVVAIVAHDGSGLKITNVGEGAGVKIQ